MLRPRELSRQISLFAARTPTLPPATHTNSYAIGAREVLLVEPATPYEDEQREWIAWVNALGSCGRTPIAIVATHHHADHVGGLADLARETGLPVWMHPATAARVGGPPAARLLTDGEALVLGDERWEVLHTPGHAPGHICLYHASSGAVVLGDMVASVGTILIATSDGGDMIAYLAQLRRLHALAPRLGLPAHGDPIDDPCETFRRYLAHRDAREKKVIAALFSCPGATVTELVRVAYADTPEHLWPLAGLSLEAHLAKLVTEGVSAEEGHRYWMK